MPKVKSLGTGQGFKTTEIGVIPVDWEVAKIGDACEVVGGSTPSTQKKEYWDGGIPWATPTDVTNLRGNVITNTEKTITELGLSNSATKLLPEGSILLTSRATIGECAINAIPMATNQGFASLICRYRAHNWFIYYYLKLIKGELQRLSGGSTFREISKKSIRAIRIPLPPLSEQKRIAEILSAVDEAIERWTKLIDKTKALKKGLMRELLTHGIGHSKFKTTEIGKIPVDWEVAKVGDVCEVVGGSTPSTKRIEYWGGDISWATPTDVTNLRGNVITNTEKTITQLGLSNSAAKLLPEGSILLTSRATIGECAINAVPMATNQGFASLVCQYRAHNWFIFYYIKLIKDELQRLSSGSTFQEVSKRSIRAIRIPIPPLAEQKQIAEILSAVDERIEKALAYKEKLETMKKGLMHALLTGKVRVKV